MAATNGQDTELSFPQANPRSLGDSFSDTVLSTYRQRLWAMLNALGSRYYVRRPDRNPIAIGKLNATTTYDAGQIRLA